MKRKTIDASREARLWIGQVIAPAVMAVATILQIPGVRDSVADAFVAKKEAVKNKFRRY